MFHIALHQPPLCIRRHIDHCNIPLLKSKPAFLHRLLHVHERILLIAVGVEPGKSLSGADRHLKGKIIALPLKGIDLRILLPAGIRIPQAEIAGEHPQGIVLPAPEGQIPLLWKACPVLIRPDRMIDPHLTLRLQPLYQIINPIKLPLLSGLIPRAVQPQLRYAAVSSVQKLCELPQHIRHIRSVKIVLTATTIKRAEAFAEEQWNGEFLYGFEIELETATAEPLTLDQFDISCPQNETTLGDIKTSDNRIYRVYMQRGSIPKGNNTYTILINLKDGTQLKGSCYLDLQAPRVDARTIEWVDEDTIKVTVNSDEAGSLYYAIQDQVDGEGTIAPKDPAQIYAQGTKVSIGYGLNYITVKGAKAGQWFCFASEDERNNRESFYSYKQIPEYTAPAPDDTEKPMITGVTVLKASDGATLKVVFNQDVKGYYDNSLTQISGINGKLAFNTTYSGEGGFESNVLTLTVMDCSITISEGSHTLTIVFYDNTILTFDFTV